MHALTEESCGYGVRVKGFSIIHAVLSKQHQQDPLMDSITEEELLQFIIDCVRTAALEAKRSVV
jgi:hypothetical protein